MHLTWPRLRLRGLAGLLIAALPWSALAPFPARATDPCAALGASLAKPRTPRVERYVEGLYDSLPTLPGFQLGEMKVETARKNGELITRMRIPGVGVAKFVRIISDDHKHLVLKDALRMDSFPGFINIANVTPLVSDRGTPTQIFATLHQMRVAGVRPGELRTLTAKNITNVETALTILHAPPVKTWMSQNPGRAIPDELVAQVIMETQTGRYMQTIATQSGHRIKSVKIENTLMITDWRLDIKPRAAELVDGIDLSGGVPMGFNVKMELEPLH